MMMQPKKTKHAKSQKVRISGVAQCCNKVEFGSYGLVAGKNVKLNEKQLEAIRKVVSRTMGGKGVIYMRVFPQLPRTKKPVGTRMGGGKSSVEEWIAPVRKGTVILEVDNVSLQIATEAFSKAKFKLAIPCFLIRREFAYL